MPSDLIRICEVFSSIQGEGPDVGQVMTFVRLSGCDLYCDWCFGEGTRILMSDWTWKPIEQINIGDYVIGVERKQKNGHFHVVSTRVTNTIHRMANTLKVNDTFYVTPNHKFLNPSYRENWQRIDSLEGKSLKVFPTEVYDVRSLEYKRGYLAGLIDGDGNWHFFKDKWLRFKLVNKDTRILERSKLFAKDLGWSLRDVTHHTSIDIPAVECTQTNVNIRMKNELYKLPYANEYKAGYLAGFFDAEGTITTKGEIRLFQVLSSQKSTKDNIDIISKVLTFAQDLGYSVGTWKNSQSNLLTIRILNPFRFIIETQPVSTKSISIPECSYRVLDQTKAITTTQGKYTTVYNLTTETGNYVAEGFIVKNCDTKYSWKDTSPSTVAQVLTQILSVDRTKKVVITGGEPLLQDRVLSQLCKELKDLNFYLALETNGHPNPPFKSLRYFDKVVVSPKRGFVNMAFLNYIQKNSEYLSKTYLKFVVKDIEDALWALTFKPFTIHQIYLQPMDGDLNIIPKIMEKMPNVKDIRFSFQIHKHMGVK